MKNVLKASILSLSLAFLLTGCESKSSKTLSCSLSNDVNSMMSMSQTIEAVFKGSELTDINQNIKMTVKDDYVSYIDSMADGVRNQYEEIKDKDGVEFKVEVKDNVIDTTLNAELKKLDDAAKKKLSINNYESETYENAKKSLEAAGYTCK